MRFLITLQFLFGITLLAYGQDSKIETIVQEGIEFHDNGDYAKAIETYKKALVLAPKSGLVNYEIALSYLSSGQYKDAIVHSKLAIDAKDGHELAAYTCYGNALDMSGESKKAIKVYEKALKEFDNYLLYYNHAITCLNAGLLDKAYKSSISAISLNPGHGSSHLVLSKVMAEEGVRVKAVLPLYFFLLIEPNSSRSAQEYQNLRDYLSYGVSKTSEKEINVLIPQNSDPDFGAAEMMISLSSASNNSKENKDKTDLELFADNNETIFSILGELKKDNTGFWWEMYVPLFYDIQTEGFTEVYSYYISQTLGESSTAWLDQNETELSDFISWINGE